MTDILQVTRSAKSVRFGGISTGLIVVVLALLPYIAFSRITGSLVSLFILIIIGSMWNLLAGFGGMVSIGQQAFVGIGAYTVIGLADQGINPYLCVIAATIVCALFAVPTSWLAFRLRGDYFAVGTWVIAEVYRLVTVRFDVLGGPTGRSLQGLSGMDADFRGAVTYWTALTVMVLAVGGCYMLLRGRVGLTLTAIRDDEIAARANGVDVSRSKRIVFLASAAGCGAAGGVLVLDAVSVQPDAIYSVQWSAYMIFIVIIGGIGYLEGPILGAIVFFTLQQFLSDYGSWYLILLGSIAVLSAIAMPRGLWGYVFDRTGFRLFPVGYHLIQPGVNLDQRRRARTPRPRRS